MSADVPTVSSAVFDLHEIAASFPKEAESMLLDRYLVDRPESSTRIFRVYRGTPAHFHQNCDEHLLVLLGRGTFWMGDPGNVTTFGPGTFLFFPRNTTHAMPTVTEYPVVFLAIDTPRRDPRDIVFVDDAEGTPESFIQPASASALPERP